VAFLQEGDELVLHNGERDHHFMRYRPGGSFGTRKGQISLPESLSYGDTLTSSSGVVFHVLRPTTAERTMKVRRTTTITYPKDAGWMILHSNVVSGCRVLECGSGSGSMTITLATLVGEEGKVYSIERRDDHLERARENVERAGLSSRVEFHLLDAAIHGFPVEGMTTCFIDVPEPWTLVRAAWQVLEGGASWLSLSPSYNQTERLVSVLQGEGFVDIETVEILERKILVRPGKTRPSERNITHTAFLTRARKINTPVMQGADPDVSEADPESGMEEREEL